MNQRRDHNKRIQRRIRILFLITTFSVGGAERHLYDLVSRLPADRYEVAVAFFKEEAQEARSMVPDFRALGVELLDLRAGSRWDLSAIWRLGRLMRRWRPDIVHAHLYRAELFGVGMARLLRVPGVVCTLHNADLYRVHELLRRLLAVSYRFADRVISLFGAETERLTERYGVPASRVVTIHHGIDTRNWVSSEQRVIAGGLMVGTVSRLARQKAQDVLLDAMARVRAKCPDAGLVIVGHDDEGLRPELEQQAASLGLNGVVRFEGYVDDVKIVLQEMNVFVLSSDFEGLPITLLEAMAFGLPVVATRVGAIPEVVVDGVTGLIVPPQDPDALAGAILRLLQNPDEAVEMGKRGHKRVLDEFSINEMVTRMCEIYDDVALSKGVVV